jgi:thiamine-phosphate pyrophosphorylase
VFPALYAILDAELTAARGLTPELLAAAWLDAGIRLIQLRAKSLQSGAFLHLADRLAALAHAAGATFIVNDRADIARLSAAAGAHVGQQDLSPADVRRILPAPAAIGLSTHNQAQLEVALSQPVELAYLAFGPVFTTHSKAQPDPTVGLEGVRLARRTVEAGRPGSPKYPIVAIGGITLARAGEVIDAGATSVAVIADLLDGDPGERARAFLRELGSAG